MADGDLFIHVQVQVPNTGGKPTGGAPVPKPTGGSAQPRPKGGTAR